MTVRELIDALLALGTQVEAFPVMLDGDGVFFAETQEVSQQDDQVIIRSQG